MLMTRFLGFSRRLGVGVVGAVCGVAIFAASASASTTLHFFSKQTSSAFDGPNGKPITNPNAAPVTGDTFDVTGLDYVGTSKKHAKVATASDHLTCTVTKYPDGLCSAEIAIGGSMLLATNFTANISHNFSLVRINGGTGKFLHARGAVHSTSVGKTNNSNFTIVYST